MNSATDGTDRRCDQVRSQELRHTVPDTIYYSFIHYKRRSTTDYLSLSLRTLLTYYYSSIMSRARPVSNRPPCVDCRPIAAVAAAALRLDLCLQPRRLGRSALECSTLPRYNAELYVLEHRFTKFSEVFNAMLGPLRHFPKLLYSTDDQCCHWTFENQPRFRHQKNPEKPR